MINRNEGYGSCRNKNPSLGYIQEGFNYATELQTVKFLMVVRQGNASVNYETARNPTMDICGRGNPLWLPGALIAQSPDRGMGAH